jgi:hypothetical protein
MLSGPGSFHCLSVYWRLSPRPFGEVQVIMEQRPIVPPSAEELQAYSLGKCELQRALEIESYLGQGPDCAPILETAPEDDLVRYLRGAGRLPSSELGTPQAPRSEPGAPSLAETLAERLARQGSLSVEEACACVREAALALQIAHEKGLVHHDIKPDTLKRLADGTVEILDFGRARADWEAVRSGARPGAEAILGTADYVAPEQAQDSRNADIRADIYSLGCTLYQLLSGSVPYPGGSVVEKVLRHSLAPPDPLSNYRPDVPAELAAVIDKMMAKDPKDRYSTPAAVAAALEPFACSDGQSPAAGGRGCLITAVLAGILVGGASLGWW